MRRGSRSSVVWGMEACVCARDGLDGRNRRGGRVCREHRQRVRSEVDITCTQKRKRSEGKALISEDTTERGGRDVRGVAH